MRLHRFFVPEPIGKSDTVVVRDSSLTHQLRHVFRFTVGGQVILLDNSGYEYRAMINEFHPSGVTFSIVSKRESPNAPSRELYLFVSIIKKDKFEWIVEKGTELGVSKFIPIVSDRSEKKSLNIERLEKIILEASEQSGKAIRPTVMEPIKFGDALLQEYPCFAFHPTGDVFTVEHAQNFSPLGVFIGPEGGWSDKEIFAFKQNKIKVYSLGNSILRAETAAIAVSTLLLLG